MAASKVETIKLLYKGGKIMRERKVQDEYEVYTKFHGEWSLYETCTDELGARTLITEMRKDGPSKITNPILIVKVKKTIIEEL